MPAFDDIVYPLKLLNIRVAFSFPYTIGRTLIRNSPINDSGVVYRIPCGCNKFYIGQSTKSVEKRITQHKYCIATNQDSSAINKHTKTCFYPILWSDSEILFKNNNFIERNLIETACIQYSKKNNINTCNGLFKTDPVFLHVIKNQYKLCNKFT